MTESKLQQIIKQGENEIVEFKQSFSKSVIETLVAFSNTKGGRILIGVADDGTVQGVSITEETVQKWINEVKQNTDPAILPVIDIADIDNKTIVVFTISEFPVKPVSYKDRFFARKQNSNHRLNAEQIT
ncbi:MAG: putative DNA binding domain-containing protein [Bacteroidales bacterium]|nr:putative DNA binding domain-containing protein [Bacteroidales bacterium]